MKQYRLTLGLVLCVAPAGLGLLHCVGDSAVAPGGDSDGGTTDGALGAKDGTSPGSDGAILPGTDGGDSGATLPPLTDAVSIAAGRLHTCVITAAQDVLCWGSNGAGQLGVPTAMSARSSVPLKVDLGGAKATMIAAGGSHTCAITTDNKIRCWGGNDRGQLGRGNVVQIGAPDVVSPPAANLALWTAPEVITAGGAFTCVGVNDGNMSGIPIRRFFCWGENQFRQSGTESTNGQPALLPSLITQSGNDSPSPGLDGFVVAAGDEFACAGFYVGAGAAFYSTAGCWGSRVAGQLGAPPLANGFEVNPTKYPSQLADGGPSLLLGLFKPGLMATGARHACVRYEQFGVTPPILDCWGDNAVGQAGSAKLSALPVTAVAGFDATNVTALAAGGRTTCVIDNGQPKCMGANDFGQLGIGVADTNPHSALTNVMAPNTAGALAVGANHACAVLSSVAGQKGKVSCWGQNESGQLGDGLDIVAGKPKATPGLVVAPM